MGVIPIVALLILAIGLTLALVGWRGRRVDDHPVCRKCRFDLAGVYPANKTCPECGRDLAGERSVRIGNRRKRRLPLGVGAGLLAVALILGGLFVTVLVGGSALNPYKPQWLLGIEALSADVDRAADAIDELSDRYVSGELSEAQIRRLASLALDGHVDPTDPHAITWMGLIELIISDRSLSEEQFTRYISQSLSVEECVVRPRAQAGQAIPVLIRFGDVRFDGARELWVNTEIIGATLNGQAVDTLEVSGRVMQGHSAGSRSNRMTRTLVVSDPPEPGTYEIKATIRQTATRWQGRPPTESAPVIATVDTPVRLRVEIVEKDVVSILQPSDAERQAMLGSLSSPECRLRPNGLVSLIQRLDSPPFSGMFQVLVRIDGQEVAISDYATYRIDQGAVGNFNRAFSNPPQGLSTLKTVDIILRPDPEAARRFVDVFEIYGEDIVLEGVPVTISGR